MKKTLDAAITKISFENVTFRYNSSLPTVLRDFSFTFSAGKSYAISGPSGAGKSTIIDLLLKFYEPQNGRILVNNIDLREILDAALRDRVILAEQTTRVFYDSIARNVQFGHDVAPQMVDEALVQVGLSDMLDALPDKSQTILRYQGSNVSGGQRQRIALARALLRDSDVLIMDESTSALDQGTRESILSYIMSHYRDRILIFVTHDPAILKQVDEIVPLSGRIANQQAASELEYPVP